jgi:hypothetical protein
MNQAGTVLWNSTTDFDSSPFLELNPLVYVDLCVPKDLYIFTFLDTGNNGRGTDL